MESAALALARLPRPLVLEGSVGDGVIHVARSPEEWMAQALRGRRDRPLFARQARRREPYEELPVCCIGAGEALLVTAGAVEAWRRGYFVALQGGHNAGPPAHYLGQYPREARQAYEAGAVGIVLFYFPRTPWPEDRGDVIVLRQARRWDHPRVLEHAPGSTPCALCGAPAAEWRETVTRARPWRERRLCGRCVADRLAPRALEQARRLDAWYRELTPSQHRELHDEIRGEVRRLARRFRHLPMPPELAAFVARWGG